MSVTHERVAAAWRFNRAADGADMNTNGQRVWSWGHHLIGDTLDGVKVAYCCHYSNSTATHSGILIREAHEVRPCPQHERPDLHKRDGDRPHKQKDYGPACEPGFKGPAACWKANPEVDCVFRCLRCDAWHPGDCYLGESDPRHGGGYNPGDSADHQLRYQCRKCETRISKSAAEHTLTAICEIKDEHLRAAAWKLLALPPLAPYDPTTWTKERRREGAIHSINRGAAICRGCWELALVAATSEIERDAVVTQ